MKVNLGRIDNLVKIICLVASFFILRMWSIENGAIKHIILIRLTESTTLSIYICFIHVNPTFLFQ